MVARPLAAGGTTLVTVDVAPPLQIELDAVLLLVVLFGGGLLCIYKGFDEYRVGRLVRDTATESVRAAAVGRTELKGVAVPAETVLTRPFTEGECLYASYRIREEREDADGDSSWTTLDSDTWVVAFRLDDGTGEILVEPEVSAKFEVSDEYTTSITVGEGQRPPPRIAEFLEQGTDVEPTTEHERQYVEEVIPPGESVYVLGSAEIRDGGRGSRGERLVVGRDGASDRFVISDMTESELTGTLSRRAPMLILFGLALSAGSLYLLLTGTGVG